MQVDEEPRAPALRVYSETLPLPDVVAPRTLALLQRYDLELVLAVRPWQLGDIGEVARAVRGAGVRLSVWPMLADDEGRWAGARNATAFAELARRACDAAGSPCGLLLDLEPPFSDARALAGGGRGIARVAQTAARFASRRRGAAYAEAARALADLVSELGERGVETTLAVWPLVALDALGEHGWQALLGTPADALDASRASVMLYTTIFEGWSRGVLARPDAEALLAMGGARAVARWGARSGISLGCVGTGAFDDEPVYRSPTELARDAAIARACGPAELSLFDLGGVLARPPAEAWLDAFASGVDAAMPRAPRQHRRTRVRVAAAVARAATWVVGRAAAPRVT